MEVGPIPIQQSIPNKMAKFLPLIIAVSLYCAASSWAQGQGTAKYLQGAPQAVVEAHNKVVGDKSKTPEQIEKEIEEALAENADALAKYKKHRDLYKARAEGLAKIQAIFNNGKLSVQEIERQATAEFQKLPDEAKKAVSDAMQYEAANFPAAARVARVKRQTSCGTCCGCCWLGGSACCQWPFSCFGK